MKFNPHFAKNPQFLVGLKTTLAVFLICLSLVGCNDNSPNNPAKTNDTTTVKEQNSNNGDTPKVIGSELTSFFIENFPTGNPAINPFEKLMGTNGNTHKIVFQFLINDKGELTLRAFGGKHQSQSFRQPGIVFKVGGVIPNTDINGKNFSLGDQEISNYSGNDFQKLRGAVNQSQYKYIILKPSLDMDEDAGIYKIKFDIGYDNIAPLKNQPFSFTSFDVVSPNPCPPRNSQ